MKLMLIASMPSKRFEPCPELCTDGRGGWVFSQVNVDRTISKYGDFWILFYLGVLVEDAREHDYVEATRLTARMDSREIGSNELTWLRPNLMWGYQDGSSIFEWVQTLKMQPERDGLITVQVEAKLNSQPDWTLVNGSAYCRITRADPTEQNELQRRFVPSLAFTIRDIFRRPFWPGEREKT